MATMQPQQLTRELVVMQHYPMGIPMGAAMGGMLIVSFLFMKKKVCILVIV